MDHTVDSLRVLLVDITLESLCQRPVLHRKDPMPHIERCKEDRHHKADRIRYRCQVLGRSRQQRLEAVSLIEEALD